MRRVGRNILLKENVSDKVGIYLPEGDENIREMLFQSKFPEIEMVKDWKLH